MRFVPPDAKRREFLAQLTHQKSSLPHFLERDPAMLSDPILARAMDVLRERQQRALEAKQAAELTEKLRTVLPGYGIHRQGNALKKTLKGLFVGLPATLSNVTPAPKPRPFTHTKPRPATHKVDKLLVRPAVKRSASAPAITNGAARIASLDAAIEKPRITRSISASVVRFTEPPPRIDVHGKRRPQHPMEEGVVEVFIEADSTSHTSPDEPPKSRPVSANKWNRNREKRKQLIEKLSRPVASDITGHPSQLGVPSTRPAGNPPSGHSSDSEDSFDYDNLERLLHQRAAKEAARPATGTPRVHPSHTRRPASTSPPTGTKTTASFASLPSRYALARLTRRKLSLSRKLLYTPKPQEASRPNDSISGLEISSMTVYQPLIKPRTLARSTASSPSPHQLSIPETRGSSVPELEIAFQSSQQVLLEHDF
ncbi:hypothetical protein HDU91_007377 [Kappamyces sp. JEL0680]|nr:hypothetical protein HDU91_007377 [Kappamyces sp. JEL0680]